MTRWNRRDVFCRVGMGAAAFGLAPGLLLPELLAEEPHLTPSPLNTLSDKDEIELGRRFATELEKEEPIVSNALIDHYLGRLVRDLGDKSQRPNLPYSIKLVNSHVPNVFSLPGGFLYLNRGLVELISSEDELVAALAHEIGHVVGRHVVNQLLLAFTAHALLKPVLDNLNNNNDVIEKIILQLGGAVAMLTNLHFNRQVEAQADLLGFYEMLRAKWDPNGLLKLLAHLDELGKSSNKTAIPFITEHAPTPERAVAIARELKLVTVESGATTDSTKFQIFKTAMGLLAEPPKRAE